MWINKQTGRVSPYEDDNDTIRTSTRGDEWVCVVALRKARGKGDKLKRPSSDSEK